MRSVAHPAAHPACKSCTRPLRIPQCSARSACTSRIVYGARLGPGFGGAPPGGASGGVRLPAPVAMAQPAQPAPSSATNVATTSPESTAVAAGAAAVVTPLYTGKKAVVVGAGPAGSTAAMFLARQGFKVDVYERRPEPRLDSVDTGRAYVIILIPRGQAALKELGIDLPSDEAFKTLGTVSHNAKGQARVNKEEGNVTFSRASLAQWLIERARERYPGAITYHFGAACEGVDLDKRKATFAIGRGEDGSPPPSQAVSYDLIVGADGVASPVRAALAAKIPGFEVNVDDSGREYKVYTGLTGGDAIEPEEWRKRLGSTLHLWTSKVDAFTSFTTKRNPDGTYSGTFSLPTGAHAKVRGPAEYETILRERFVGVPPDWIPIIAEQVSDSPASPAGKRVRCSQLYGPGCLLLGDAAHAVTPVFGQGANSALESCLVLGKVLQDAGGNVDAVPKLFHEERVADAHGLYELDRKAYSFFRRRGPLDPDFLQLLAHVVLGTILSKIVPFLYGTKPALLQLGSGLPYSQIMAAVRRDAAWAAAGVAVLALWGLAKVLGFL